MQTTNFISSLRKVNKNDFVSDEDFKSKFHVGHQTQSKSTFKPNFADNYKHTFDRKFDCNQLSQFPTTSRFHKRPRTASVPCNRAEKSKMRETFDFTSLDWARSSIEKSRPNTPRYSQSDDHYTKIQSILVNTKYPENHQEPIDRMRLSNGFQGTDQKFKDVEDDKKQFLHQSTRNQNQNKCLGDKITNKCKDAILCSPVKNVQIPLKSARSHEIGSEFCDRLRGNNLAYYVKRI